MAKTLADMAAKERADCVGMWALIEGTNLAVIAEADGTNTCVVVYPQWDGDSTVHLNEMVAPLPDLPRAWTPDGEPELAQALAEETWEYAAAWDESKGMHISFWHSQREHAEVDMHLMGKAGAPNPRIVRRRVSEPEVVG